MYDVSLSGEPWLTHTCLYIPKETCVRGWEHSKANLKPVCCQNNERNLQGLPIPSLFLLRNLNITDTCLLVWRTEKTDKSIVKNYSVHLKLYLAFLSKNINTFHTHTNLNSLFSWLDAGHLEIAWGDMSSIASPGTYTRSHIHSTRSLAHEDEYNLSSCFLIVC